MSIKPKKSLGQNFLRDSNIIRKIIQVLDCPANNRVIEIGPGTGALTKELIEKYKHFTAIEIDRRAYEFLKNEYPDLDIRNRDILKLHWDEVIEEQKTACVIGNLPYYITSPILFHILDNRKYFRQAVFMVQKEVALRIAAEPRTKEYGILSVQLQLMCEVKYEFTVSRQVFYPIPNVDSAVISLSFNTPALKCSDIHLKKVVRTAFGQRRKKLRNALSNIISSDTDIPFDLSRRAEELTPHEFEDLTVWMEQSGILSP